MEQLSELPTPALIVFAITLALIYGVRYFGLFSGANASPEKSAAAAQVAAVIVDSTELRKATVALESHTLATNRLVAAVEGASKAVDELAHEADRVREELHISREIARRER